MFDKKADTDHIPAPLPSAEIGSIFSDAVVLNTDFIILSVSENIRELLDVNSAEIMGKCVSCLSSSFDLRSLVTRRLKEGFFEKETVELPNKRGDQLMFELSGLVINPDCIHRNIVLRLKHLPQQSWITRPQDLRSSDIDRFVYVSAHELRGPLATIKGLLYLTRYSDAEEIKTLVAQADDFVEMLDNKLHQLIFFAEADKENQVETAVPLTEIVLALQAEIAASTIDHPVSFRCIAENKNELIHYGPDVLAMLKNVILFFVHQKKSTDNEITLDTHSSMNSRELMVRARGFYIQEKLRPKLNETLFGYSEILRYPDLINCYAAKKIISKLGGQLQFIQPSEAENAVMVTIPQSPPAAR